MATRVIPNYALYGVQAQPDWHSWFDFEWIPQRSRPHNWKIRPHKHDALIQILYVEKGSVEVLYDDAKTHIRAPCLVLIPAQTVHGFHFSDDVDGPVVTAAQRPLESLLGATSPELVPLIRKPAILALAECSHAAQALMPLFLALEREAQHQEEWQFTAGMGLLMALCVQAARLLRGAELKAPSVSSRKSLQIEKFRTLVDAHFKEHWPIMAYAEQLGITPGQLSRLCREVLGMSSLDVINARLIHEAQRDLVYTSNSSKQLAFQLGFSDEAYFGRFFRKHTGLSPREFRARSLEVMLKPEGVAKIALPVPGL